jgi:phospholipid/cholesterol/gamma-HCH transport system permease protein
VPAPSLALLPPSIEVASENGETILYLQGSWRLAQATAVADDVRRLPLSGSAGCVLDGSRLAELDTAAAFLLLREMQRQGIDTAQLGVRAMRPGEEKLLDLVRARMVEAPAIATTQHLPFLQRIGISATNLAATLATHASFVGHLTVELFALLRQPRLFRLKETVAQFEVVTLDAIPIAALVSFLIGVVFAYLLGVQAQTYGATIFVVDGVGIAICRELAPLLVAVIVAGRSGAAFTAQIGSMKVQEETDAIRTLGLSPIQVLVIPRLVAIVVGLPLLVFIGDLAGIAGGIVISATQLDITPRSFISRLHSVLPISAVVIGIAKAPVFASAIAVIACRMGLSVERDARSVGQHTTSTVVQSIVWVIVLDAVFAIALQRAGL